MQHDAFDDEGAAERADWEDSPPPPPPHDEEEVEEEVQVPLHSASNHAGEKTYHVVEGCVLGSHVT